DAVLDRDSREAKERGAFRGRQRRHAARRNAIDAYETEWPQSPVMRPEVSYATRRPSAFFSSSRRSTAIGPRPQIVAPVSETKASNASGSPDSIARIAR